MLTSTLQPLVSKLFPINRIELLQRDLHVSQVLHTVVFGSLVARGHGCLVLLGVVLVQRADSLGGEGEEGVCREAEGAV